MELEQRVEALERRLAALERPADTAAAAAPAPPAGDWWLLERLAQQDTGGRDGASGRVAYGGVTQTRGGGEVVWQAEHDVADLLEMDLRAAVPVLSALAHPVRLDILRALLAGARTLGELQAGRSAGQVHHHLRELRTAGLVRAARNDFSVVPERVVPVLVALAAAAGPTGVAPPEEEL